MKNLIRQLVFPELEKELRENIKKYEEGKKELRELIERVGKSRMAEYIKLDNKVVKDMTIASDEIFILVDNSYLTYCTFKGKVKLL